MEPHKREACAWRAGSSGSVIHTLKCKTKVTRKKCLLVIATALHSTLLNFEFNIDVMLSSNTNDT